MLGWKYALDTGRWAWDNRAGIKPALKAFQKWFWGSQLLVIGPGGTGKTTMAHIFSGKYNWMLDSPWNYEQDVGVKRFELKADPTAEMLVMPGQEHRRHSTWSGVGKDLAKGVYQGVILVSAYGYHSLGVPSYKKHKLHEPKQRERHFLERYLESCRQDEIAVLKQLVPHLKECRQKLWIASVITKQDLWIASETAVEKWYAEGEYGQLIEEVLRNNGPTFRHEYHPVSLVIGNFVTHTDEILAKNREGYDHKRQVESVRRLHEILDGLRKWRSGK
jgi:hypothetical protein